jgi:pimeloyl-ACP methyl ester carboxylesterase
MPTVREMGLMANAAYETAPTVPGWACTARRAAARLNGFQAATFVNSGITVLAFRGTAQAMDVAADLKLGVGMNSTYFSDAEDYAFDYQHLPNVYVCGHSLGGAIAQVVSNRHGLKFVTFNAPGVAVFASRNVMDASLGMTAVRSAGMVLSAFRHPMQAARDMRSTFNTAHGLNVCLQNDMVSKIGLHYGEVIRIPGTSANPLTEHSMNTVSGVLQNSPIGGWDASGF